MKELGMQGTVSVNPLIAPDTAQHQLKALTEREPRNIRPS